jgi:carboxypeptidase C (cathepsin A)
MVQSIQTQINCIPLNACAVSFVCLIGIQWFSDHPEFLTNPFYIGGDSYAGKLVPFLAQIISEGIDFQYLLHITDISIYSCL